MNTREISIRARLQRAQRTIAAAMTDLRKDSTDFGGYRADIFDYVDSASINIGDALDCIETYVENNEDDDLS